MNAIRLYEYVLYAETTNQAINRNQLLDDLNKMDKKVFSTFLPHMHRAQSKTLCFKLLYKPSLCGCNSNINPDPESGLKRKLKLTS